MQNLIHSIFLKIEYKQIIIHQQQKCQFGRVVNQKFENDVVLSKLDSVASKIRPINLYLIKIKLLMPADKIQICC